MTVLACYFYLIDTCNIKHIYMLQHRELWQGQRWVTDPLYHAASARILNEEVYPGDRIIFHHPTLGNVVGRVKKFYTKVGLIMSNEWD